MKTIRNVVILFVVFVFFACIPIFCTSNEHKLIASFPEQGIYYYFIPNFDINTFKKPQEIKESANGSYHIFVYNKDIPAKTFEYNNGYKIQDSAGDLLEMISVAINNHPNYYIVKGLSDENNSEVSLCEFKANNDQIKYLLNFDTGKFVKQLMFNNGQIGIGSICNPNYIPGRDI